MLKATKTNLVVTKLAAGGNKHDSKVLLDTQEKITDSHFWKSETSPNQGTWLGFPGLGLVSLYQIWDFYEYSLNTLKYPKMGIRYFFPVIPGGTQQSFKRGGSSQRPNPFPF